jgi:hypothetical protein
MDGEGMPAGGVSEPCERAFSAVPAQRRARHEKRRVGALAFIGVP